MNQENKKPWCFCETPEEKCTMNYCDENGCQNRKRHLVEENKQLPTAEEELMDAENTLFRHVSKVYNLSDVIDAIEEHTRLHTAPLREELEKLRAENEQFRRLYMKALDHRAKLRNALEYAIKALSVVTSSVIQKSILPELKEALKGGSDE